MARAHRRDATSDCSMQSHEYHDVVEVGSHFGTYAHLTYEFAELTKILEAVSRRFALA